MADRQPSGLRPSPAVSLVIGAWAVACLPVFGCARTAPAIVQAPMSAEPVINTLAAHVPDPQPPLVYWQEPFNTLEPDRWKEMPVNGHSEYRVVTLDGRACLKAVSDSGASILLSPIQFDPEEFEWLSWEWRVEQFTTGEALDTKDGSDAAARVYVYFQTAGLPWQKRSLDYVWSRILPNETLMNSAFASASKILVVETGESGAGQWRTEERNLEEDFERAFGKQDLPDVIGIGLMTDSDNSKTSTAAYFDTVRVSRTRMGLSEAP